MSEAADQRQTVTGRHQADEWEVIEPPAAAAASGPTYTPGGTEQ